MISKVSNPLSMEDFLDSYSKDKGNQPRNLNTRDRKTPTFIARVSRLRAAQGAPPAIIKVLSRGKGSAYPLRGAAYISRGDNPLQATLFLEDEFGNQHYGDLETVERLIDTWSPLFSGRANGTSAIHLMVSSPKGTAGNVVMDAAREFFKDQFPDRKYLLALHTDTTFHHVHGIVSYRSLDQKILPTSREDLGIWRSGWAQALSEQGVAVNAERRWQLGKEKAAPSKAYYPNKDGRNKKSKKDRKSAPYSVWGSLQKRAWTKDILQKVALRNQVAAYPNSETEAKQLDAHVAVLFERLKKHHRLTAVQIKMIDSEIQKGRVQSAAPERQ